MMYNKANNELKITSKNESYRIKIVLKKKIFIGTEYNTPIIKLRYCLLFIQLALIKNRYNTFILTIL